MSVAKYHLTKKGLQRVKKEYQSFIDFKKMKTKGQVPPTWESEEVNPDYLAFQEDMSLLDARLTEYENILNNVDLIILPPKKDRSSVCMGATVTLQEIPGGMINEYTLLGSMEANPAEGKISSDSPVGKELLGKAMGEEVLISSPIRVVYKVKKIVYSL